MKSKNCYCAQGEISDKITSMQTIYSQLKVNNEFELCEIPDEDSKAVIERELLKHRISYFIKFNKPSIFSRNKSLCTICVNEASIDEAEAIITQLCEDMGFQVRFLIKHSSAGDDLF